MDYGPALKLLNWFHEKVKVKVNKGKRGNKRYAVIDEDISFTYEEARYRGLSPQQTSRALKELHQFGFIDVKQPGSGLRGDWTKYALSDRWKDFGTPNFQHLTYPKSIKWLNFGFGGKENI